jgi:excisionase family DNA binding protein
VAASASALLDYFISRLPRGDFLTVSDVAVALNVSADAVYGWIEAGEVRSVKWGLQKAFYKIYRPSLIEFLRGRIG